MGGEDALLGLVAAPGGPVPVGVDEVRALFAYEGAGAELVVGLKHRNRRGALGRLAAGLARTVAAEGWDAVTWAPTGVRRRQRRGFDQAELLARSLAGQLRLPCLDLLVRREGPAQTGRAARDRAVGVAFAARRRPPPRVLVVDDVLTTGATLSAAARALRAAGARRVGARTLARTPATAPSGVGEAAAPGPAGGRARPHPVLACPPSAPPAERCSSSPQADDPAGRWT